MKEYASDGWERKRTNMVERQIVSRGVSDIRVIEAMKKVPREQFVPQEMRISAYEDRPLPIGEGQTISQPYIVALMTELCGIEEGDRVLEIGTGSGYQTAILSELASEVYTIEVYESLSKKAEIILNQQGYTNIHFIVGNGYEGYEEGAPYDSIILTAAPRSIPDQLVEQLNEGGVLVGPVGSVTQNLVKLTKSEGEVSKKTICSVAFVPMVNRRGNTRSHD
jgi:protein-L-isoaspartate(D-aspartate) O-methyltransferase